jgi:hypothetical protein
MNTNLIIFGITKNAKLFIVGKENCWSGLVEGKVNLSPQKVVGGKVCTAGLFVLLFAFYESGNWSLDFFS